MSLEKAVRFLLHNIICFAEKKRVHQKYQNFLGGNRTNWIKRFSDKPKVSKIKHMLEGSRHPNFLIFKIFRRGGRVRGHNVPPPFLVTGYAQIRWGK